MERGKQELLQKFEIKKSLELFICDRLHNIVALTR